MADFATPSDIFRPRPVPADREDDVRDLIAAASNWIRTRKPEIADDDPAARVVVIQVVRAAMATEKYAGHVSYTKTVGGVTRSGTLANPGALLIFEPSHYQLLGISQAGAPSYFFGGHCG
ncbi:hypothetical protein M1M07_23685 [Rhodococcus sp. HM1]|uniref:hypothetical protein n=1 Tax=Rhodococcus sp. HM1 TaxID=2937759 RepID=UPI00200B190B|nr:hypothetical protein [Rhodococcus sp. HM1]MCK8674100.1 hypothetical protein [Rhodococcus sp. HM1]